MSEKKGLLLGRRDVKSPPLRFTMIIRPTRSALHPTPVDLSSYWVQECRAVLESRT